MRLTAEFDRGCGLALAVEFGSRSQSVHLEYGQGEARCLSAADNRPTAQIREQMGGCHWSGQERKGS